MGKSIEAYQKLRSLNEGNSLGCYHMAIVYKAIGKYKNAIDCLLKIFEESPKIVSVNYHLGLAYLGVMDIENALKFFKNVIKLDPEHKAAKGKLDEIINDQDMIYSYGIEIPKDEKLGKIANNYYLGQAYKGFTLLEKSLKHFKDKLSDEK